MRWRDSPLSRQAPSPHGLQPKIQAAATFSPARVAALVDKVGRRPYTNRWTYRVFQIAPDLIRSLLPGSEACLSSELNLDPAAPGDRLYRFEALELKELSHRWKSS